MGEDASGWLGWNMADVLHDVVSGQQCPLQLGMTVEPNPCRPGHGSRLQHRDEVVADLLAHMLLLVPALAAPKVRMLGASLTSSRYVVAHPWSPKGWRSEQPPRVGDRGVVCRPGERASG